MSVVYYSVYESPVGSLLLAGDGMQLSLISFPEGRASRQPEPDWLRRNDAFKNVKIQLKAYFGGELTEFDLPLAPQGTEFQLLVWNALKTIPYGETRSYGDIAAQVGRPDASRAVGAANGQNPIPIVIPCHRVIGRDGSLTGFGGGLACKQHLLALEQQSLPFSLS
ncbi:methylated-DNA--[protein]-cysteine S-methyltransferase [Pseudohongiella spirulinae]|uniref:Methylated-DNA--protein-cysteine methyltransferase n=1 Tax=Pseudohongiella spirulinae TaxID=1249552 RepID=A0A0S2KCF4_9GAMM|nr:methylated-DNA--[protein]-cysteine S-methyltransferase [Pseudohongiella spirulinae]ALO46006.1 cysteine methyltransferase [Pseudohongiella spirulinae]